MNTHHSIKPYCGVKVKLYVFVAAELKGGERYALFAGYLFLEKQPSVLME